MRLSSDQPLRSFRKDRNFRSKYSKYSSEVSHWHGASPGVELEHLYIIPNALKGVIDWRIAITREH